MMDTRSCKIGAQVRKFIMCTKRRPNWQNPRQTARAYISIFGWSLSQSLGEVFWILPAISPLSVVGTCCNKLPSISSTSIDGRILTISVITCGHILRIAFTCGYLLDMIENISSAAGVTETGAELGFYKGGCPIHLKGAPEVKRRRPRGGWTVGSGEARRIFVFLISKCWVFIHSRRCLLTL